MNSRSSPGIYNVYIYIYMIYQVVSVGPVPQIFGRSWHLGVRVQGGGKLLVILRVARGQEDRRM